MATNGFAIEKVTGLGQPTSKLDRYHPSIPHPPSQSRIYTFMDGTPNFSEEFNKLVLWEYFSEKGPWDSWDIIICLRFYGPSQPNGVMSSAVSLPNHTFTGQSSKQLTSIVHIPSPETDNCPSWISGRERMTIKNISWSISMKECCRPPRGLNPKPPGLQSDGASNWATEAGWDIIIR